MNKDQTISNPGNEVLITDIRPVKKRRNRFAVFTNGEYWMSLDTKVLVESGISVNDTIDSKTLESIRSAQLEQDCMNDAVRYLAYRTRSTREVRSKLYTKKYDREIIEKVIRNLTDTRLLNDEEFTELFVREKIKLNNWGPVRIRSELAKKGIPGNMADAVLESELPAETIRNNLQILIEKQLTSEKKMDNRFLKSLFNRCIRNGYPAGYVNDALQLLRRDNEGSTINERYKDERG